MQIKSLLLPVASYSGDTSQMSPQHLHLTCKQALVKVGYLQDDALYLILPVNLP